MSRIHVCFVYLFFSPFYPAAVEICFHMLKLVKLRFFFNSIAILVSALVRLKPCKYEN